MKNLIIAAQHLINEIVEERTSKKGILFNTSIRNYNFALNPTMPSKAEIMIAFLEKSKNLPLEDISEVIKFPETINSLIQFSLEMHNLGITIDDLPKDTKLNKEIALVLSLLNDIIPKPDIPNNSNVQAYTESLSFDQSFYLSKHGIQSSLLPNVTPATVNLKFGLNIRHEIEACIQEIMVNNLSNVTIALPNLSNHIPLIEATLKRYGKPHSLQDRSVSLSKSNFIALMDFAKFKDLNSLKTALACNAFNLYTASDIAFYIDHFEMTINDILNSFDLAKDVKNIQLINIQNRIQSDVLKLQEHVRNIFSNSYFENLNYAYALIATNSKINSQPLYNFIVNHFDLFEEKHHSLLIYFVENIPLPALECSFARFVDIQNLPLKPVEYLYVLNLSGSNYPSLSARSGLIDEQYLSKINGYPTLDVRNKYALNQQKRFYSLSKNLTLSYSISTYEGKGLELSYPVSVYAKENKIIGEAWKIDQITSLKKRKLFLSPNLAQNLYLHEGKIIGSVSSLELYTRDPLKYFLEKGLKLKEPELPIFDARTLGTLNHEIVENIKKQASENLWDKLWLSFPKHSQFYQAIKARNDEFMSLNTQLLNDVAESISFETMDRERYFINDSIHPKIELRGIIDRVDATEDKLLIIDYKSSAQSLSVDKIISGNQLQLLSYAKIAQTMYHKDVLGVFYFGFNMPNLKRSDLSFKSAKGILSVPFEAKKEWVKQKRLSGWFFEQPESRFNSSEYFKNLKTNKDDIIKASSLYDYEITIQNLYQVYDDIQKNILNGVLELDEMTFTLNKDVSFKAEKEDNNDTI